MRLTAPLLLFVACSQLPTGQSPRPNVVRPIVIGHRGASGYRPEHTIESYRLAIVMGADFIEPDLVPTRDGVLIARHESRINDTTNIEEMVERGELPDRKTTKIIDGESLTGYFTEDYTLAELKTLHARERIANHRPQNTAYNDQERIPTLAEVIAYVRRVEKITGLAIGIYPETKHPTFFAEEGKHDDGSPIGMDLSEMLIETLVAENFTDPRRVIIQSFEFSNLIRLRREIMPRHGVAFPLAQLFGDASVPPQESPSFSRPYDMTYNARHGRDLKAIYGSLTEIVEITETTSYGDLTDDAVVRFLAEHSASALAPWKNNLLLDEETRAWVRRARQLGLDVHPYTFRAEEHFLSLEAEGKKQGITREILNLLDLGVTGFFTDFPDHGRFARDLWMQRQAKRSR